MTDNDFNNSPYNLLMLQVYGKVSWHLSDQVYFRSIDVVPNDCEVDEVRDSLTNELNDAYPGRVRY